MGVSGDEDVVLLSDKGMMIRLPIDQVSETGRVTQGVRLMRMQEGHRLVTVALVAKGESEEQTALFENNVEEAPAEEVKAPEVEEAKAKEASSLFDLLDDE